MWGSTYRQRILALQVIGSRFRVLAGTTRDQVIIAKKGTNNTHQCGVQFGDAYGGTGQNSPYYWIVQGLSVIPADSTQFVNEGINVMASYVTINNCVIDGAGYTMDGGLLSAGNYVTVQNSTVARTVGTGLIGHGIYLGGGGSTSANTIGCKVLHNIIHDCSAVGLQLNGDDGPTTMMQDCLVDGNTFYNNGYDAITFDCTKNSTISNNLIYSYQTEGIAIISDHGTPGSTGNVVVNNTIYFGSGKYTGKYDAIMRRAQVPRRRALETPSSTIFCMVWAFGRWVSTRC